MTARISNILLISCLLLPWACTKMTSDAGPGPEAPAAGKLAADRGTPRAIEICSKGRFPEVFQAFRNCRRWRLALEEACGARTQPSFLDPCRCMCDLCLVDADCTLRPDGRCIELPSAYGGGYEEKLCVYPGDACGGSNPPCPAGRFCMTHGGRPACEEPFREDRGHPSQQYVPGPQEP